MSFAQLNLAPALLTNLDTLGFTQPTKVQAEAIPEIMAGHDLMAGARTGTGKTAAYALPIMHALLQTEPQTARLQALILVPTRELAQQVADNLNQYSQHTRLRTALIYGGAAFEPQQKALAQGVNILVATPGRLLDHLRKKTVNLGQLTHLVFDEADRMLDMGFKDEISAILRQLPRQRQTLLFSATFDDSIFRFSRQLLKQPKLVEVDKRNSAAQDITQQLYEVDDDRKAPLLAHLLSHKDWRQVLIFSRTKQACDQLSHYLQQQGLTVATMHGDLSQKVRTDVLTQFKAGELQALIATDVAARGLDIDDLPVVINMELPYIAEDYVHRIGRTGRAGNTGLAMTFFNNKDARQLEELEVLLDCRLPRQWYPGFEPDLTRLDDSPKLSKAAQKQRARKRALGGNTRRRR